MGRLGRSWRGGARPSTPRPVEGDCRRTAPCPDRHDTPPPSPTLASSGGPLLRSSRRPRSRPRAARSRHPERLPVSSRRYRRDAEGLGPGRLQPGPGLCPGQLGCEPGRRTWSYSSVWAAMALSTGPSSIRCAPRRRHEAHCRRWRATHKRPSYSSASSACPKSATRSSVSSSPTLTRTNPSERPAATKASGESCRCVVEPGCVTRV